MLNSLPPATVIIGWIIFGAIFLFRRKPAGKTVARKRDRDSILGVALQSVALGLVWIRRPRGMSILPLGFWFELVIAMIIVALVVASLWLMWAAVRTLGKQWSITARVLEDHALVTQGPYNFVRHPIYTGMLGMLLAAGLAFSQWIGFAVALAFFAVGTLIRVRSEEKLLREQFGAPFDDYARRVPAVLPLRKPS